MTERQLTGVEMPIRFSGIVTSVRARHEGARYDSDVFLINDGVLPAQVVELAEVATTRVEPEIFVPPLPGAGVRRAAAAERDHALFFDQMTSKLPIGTGRDGEPLYVNLEFLDGTRGAHVNISGISGVATKTTYAAFLLYSLFGSKILGKEALNSKALIFNVKGEDLLFLDHPNNELGEEDRERYASLGLPSGPFNSVAFYAPPRRGDSNAGPDVATRTTGVHSYYWTLAEFCEQELMPFVFADAEDDRNQYTLVIHNVTAVLKTGERVGDDGAWKIEGQVLRTYRELVDLLVERLSDDSTRAHWAGPAMGAGTTNAFIRRLLGSQRGLGPLIRADVPMRVEHSISTSEAQVTVVDLHNLADRAKRFVVGVTIRRAFDDEGAGRTTEATPFRRARRAEQVRSARRELADQRDSARCRRARSVAWNHSYRLPADRQRGGAQVDLQLGYPRGRTPRPGRSRSSRVRVPAAWSSSPSNDCQAGHDVRVAAGAPNPACRRVPLPRLGDPSFGELALTR